MKTFAESFGDRVAALEGATRERALAWVTFVAYSLSLSARDTAASIETEPITAARRLYALTALMHVLAKQALSLQGVSDVGYPWDAWFVRLSELATDGTLDELQWS